VLTLPLNYGDNRRRIQIEKVVCENVQVLRLHCVVR
jgi:hypothetical protein